MKILDQVDEEIARAKLQHAENAHQLAQLSRESMDYDKAAELFEECDSEHMAKQCRKAAELLRAAE